MVNDFESTFHVARLAFLAMSARSVASAEFENDPEVSTVVFAVSRCGHDAQPSIDLKFRNSSGMALGGMAL